MTNGFLAPGVERRYALSTLIELVEQRAHESAQMVAFRFLTTGDADGPVEDLSHEGLLRQARAIAIQLQHARAQGQRALLLYPAGLEFINAFFGCLLAGTIAVPAYAPDPARLERSLLRLRAIARDCGARTILTTSAMRAAAQALLPAAPELEALHWLATDTVDPDSDGTWRRPEITSNSVAFLQYTSGSTGAPKGVMVSHGNLLHNSESVRRATRQTPQSRFVMWLPMYHDMGLIGGIIQPLYTGCSAVLLSPTSFLHRPLRWLTAISKFRGTSSAAPNFAYDLCARKITEAEKQDLDLSCWDVAFNGAEPVRPDTLHRFHQAFASCGFRKETLYPCYGLAEATLFVSGGDRDMPPRSLTVDAVALAQRSVSPAQVAQAPARSLTSCGHTWLDQQVCIVDPETRKRCKPDQVGEIWISGASVALGYWGRAEETRETFQARLADGGDRLYLRTGDLGFVSEGELYIAGRLKDTLIIRGQNHYPQDLEHTVEHCHPQIRPGCTAAFAWTVNGQERIGIAAEVSSAEAQVDLDKIVAAVQSAVAREHELQTYVIALLPRGAIPKTSSGKIQRSACRDGLLGGTLEALVVAKCEDATDESTVYSHLEAKFARIDHRHTRYRFDLETDIRWDLVAAPGLYIGQKFLSACGMIDPERLREHPEAQELFQWAFALVTCEDFRALEEALIEFTAEEQDQLGSTRSLALLEEEEVKHMRLFGRYAAHLASLRPELAERLKRRRIVLNRNKHLSTAAYHYLVWLYILLFEEYSIVLHDKLLEEADGIQPAWLSAHAAHRREEAQHMVTDMAYLDALKLSDEERWRWSAVFLQRAPKILDQIFPVETAFRLCIEQYPEIARSSEPLLCTGEQQVLRDRALHRLLRLEGSFARVKKVAPAVRAFVECPELPRNWRESPRWVTSAPPRSTRATTAQPIGALEITSWIEAWLTQSGYRGTDAFDPQRPFCDYGLDSLATVELASALEDHLGHALSPTVAWIHPTPELLARYLINGPATPASSAASPSAHTLQHDMGHATGTRTDSVPVTRAIALQPEGKEPPFFCVHPAGGTVVAFRELAALIGKERPFYVLMAKGFEDHESPHESVEEMAESYLADVRALQPEGPYCLGGWSFGGLVAFEMARRLAQAGAEVSAVVMFDSPTPEAVSVLEFADDIAVISYLAAREGMAMTEQALRDLGPERALEFFAEVGAKGHYLPQGAGERYLRRMLRIFRANMRAMHAYVPGSYAGPVTLLRACDQEEPLWRELGATLPCYGWSQYVTGPLAVREIPGSHFSLIKTPQVERLAEVLCEILPRHG